MRFLKQEQGRLFISDLFRILIIVSLILSFIYLPKPFVTYIKLSHMCETIVHSIEVAGGVTAEVNDLIDQLKSTYGIEPEISIEGAFIEVAGERRIQLKSQFTVTIEDTVELVVYRPSFINPVTINLPLSKKLIGVGHVYWKGF